MKLKNNLVYQDIIVLDSNIKNVNFLKINLYIKVNCPRILEIFLEEMGNLSLNLYRNEKA